MQTQAQQNDLADRRALREFADMRPGGLVIRLAIYALAAALGAIFVPVSLVAIYTGLIAASAFAEYFAAKAFLAAGMRAVDLRGADTADPPHANILAATHIAASIAIAFAIATIWVYTVADEKILPLSFLAIALLDSAVDGCQILRLMMLRQVLYLGTALAMILRDIMDSNLAPDGVTLGALGAGLLPVILLAVAALSASHTRARTYRDQLRREQQLADACDATEQANASKNSFIATVSHELRTQLTGVLGMAKTLLTTKLTKQQREQATIIAESGRCLNTLLNDILDYAKLEAGKLAIDPAVEDLRGAVDHIARLFGTLAAEKGLELQVVIDPEIPERLVFDPVRVRQCLSNLISNAIKFTESGSVRVAVTCEPRGLGPDGVPRYLITVIVADTGIGVPAGGLAQLFQPFSQADESIARRFGGIGLGLNITRQLAESMGGSITLESTSDEGSVFRLTFAADGTGDTGHVQPSDEAPPVLIDRRVLVVDDVESNRMVMRRFLRTLGVEVVDGLAALEALTQSRFDAAFLDLNMPGMGGAEIASRVRRGEAGRRGLPLLAFSADSAILGVETGADGFDATIVKPVDLRQLQHTLTDAIRRRAQGHPPSP